MTTCSRVSAPITKGIINLDLDYFALPLDEEEATIAPFTDQVIVKIFRAVRRALSKTHVVTIALSPECCGGWSAADRLCALA